MRILNQTIPVNIFEKFVISERSYRLIFPKFNLSKIKDNNFIFNASKILNYLLVNDIPYYILSASVFKKRLKSHLINMQNQSITGDVNWLPCNHDLFSQVTVWRVFLLGFLASREGLLGWIFLVGFVGVIGWVILKISLNSVTVWMSYFYCWGKSFVFLSNFHRYKAKLEIHPFLDQPVQFVDIRRLFYL